LYNSEGQDIMTAGIQIIENYNDIGKMQKIAKIYNIIITK